MPPPNCIRQEKAHCGYNGKYLVPVSHQHAHHADQVIHALQKENKRLHVELSAALAHMERKKSTPNTHAPPADQPIMSAEANVFLQRIAKAAHDGLVASNERKVRNMFMGDFASMMMVEFNEIMENYEDVAEQFTTGPRELEKLPESLDKKTIKAWFEVFKNYAIQLEMADRQKKGVARRLEEATAHVPNKYMQDDDDYDAWEGEDAKNYKRPLLGNKARAVRNIVNRAIANKRRR